VRRRYCVPVSPPRTRKTAENPQKLGRKSSIPSQCVTLGRSGNAWGPKQQCPKRRCTTPTELHVSFDMNVKGWSECSFSLPTLSSTKSRCSCRGKRHVMLCDAVAGNRAERLKNIQCAQTQDHSNHEGANRPVLLFWGYTLL
jgi:hypothetical protein